MQDRTVAQVHSAQTAHGIEVVATIKVLKNTYLLLAMTLAFSAFTAFLARDAAPLNPWLFLIGFIGLSFVTQMLANSVWGLVGVFAFTGFVGFAIGPLLNMLMQSSLGSEIVMQALGGTAVIFLGLSAYAVTTKKDFSFMSGFLTAGALVLMLGVVASLFLKMPMLNLALSGGFMLFSSALILYQTGEIVNGGERNYILATITLYATIYNIFLSLLNILTALSGED